MNELPANEGKQAMLARPAMNALPANEGKQAMLARPAMLAPPRRYTLAIQAPHLAALAARL